MKYNPAVHKRKSIRLKGYDYSQAGLYFITICVQDRELLFGKIENDEMILNDAGRMIQTEWEKLPQRFSNIELHEFVVMPNHFHAILQIVEPAVGATLVVAQNDKGAQNDRVAQNDKGAQNDRVAQNDKGAQNDRVAQNDKGAQNDRVAQNDKGAQNDRVAQNDKGAQNDRVAQNDKGVKNDVVAQNDKGAQNDGVAQNDTVAPNETDVQNEPGTQNNAGGNDDTGQPGIRATTTIRATTRVAPTDAKNDTRGKNEPVAPTTDARDKTVGDMMAAFKSITTVEYIRGVKNLDWQPFNGKLWQRNYFEHIIRNEQAYENISEYIIYNAAQWLDDKFYRA